MCLLFLFYSNGPTVQMFSSVFSIQTTVMLQVPITSNKTLLSHLHGKSERTGNKRMTEVRMTTCALWRVPSDLLYRLPVCQTGLPHEYVGFTAALHVWRGTAIYWLN